MDSTELNPDTIAITYSDVTDAEMSQLLTRFDDYRLKSKSRLSWARVDWAIQTSIEMIAIMHRIANRGIEGPHKGNDTIARFYNETVAFILGGKRSMRIELWNGIIENHAGLRSRLHALSNVGSLNTGGNPFVGKTDSAIEHTSTGGVPFIIKVDGNSSGRNTLTALKINNELLSYGLPEIVKMWISRENGINDMLYTLVSLLQLYAKSNVSNP